ncbi:hypothetical protein AMES_7174 [Amycolatopsis mediterranei S699]|uniref:Uncharacterized protein n=2 Tax=Amycolatopsis mediterranei TaxID=33910 RepID=A0A0H3DDI2_AMYMU|nr:hypothetical protein [Amycolatopsis mediterranei]ADJ49000.1 hypothetical protein AMED_7284 [Amycolatopsis mediterranei U32]AEK45950.1 hypothetical protein RAM_37415 [Amycolatopsis mediterranei S699]AFO80708.1 hypothetical protein AMES_7174 [Amycolatopsis mediterranei S699]AGT87836.1 hypothetical protein B737_7174 [Amycolatopsis mediterranei RB]KDU93882.1 hypothetical protein DV36_00655 [Amycolatopsis mediterranei]
MTTGLDGGAENYLVLQRKGQLFPAVTLAAYRLHRLAVWRGRTPIDPHPAFDVLEDAVVQATFFGDDDLNAMLESLLAAARSFVDSVRMIQDSSRPGFGGNVQEPHRGDDADVRQKLQSTIESFVTVARADLCIEGSWRSAFGDSPAT